MGERDRELVSLRLEINDEDERIRSLKAQLFDEPSDRTREREDETRG